MERGYVDVRRRGPVSDMVVGGARDPMRYRKGFDRVSVIGEKVCPLPSINHGASENCLL